MSAKIQVTSIILLMCLASAIDAQTPPTTDSPRASASLRPPPDAPPIKETPPGPYAVTLESDPGLPTHTVYRPSDLQLFKGSKRLPAYFLRAATLSVEV